MKLINELTGESIKVCTPEEAYDAFCELIGEDCGVQSEYEADLEDLAQEVVDCDEEYHDAQNLYMLITEAKNEQIVLAEKLDEIARLQRQQMNEKFAKLQEVAKTFNELYEAEKEFEEEYDEEVDCGYDCKSCGYEECPERMADFDGDIDAPYNSASSSFKSGKNFFEVEARWNAPVSDDAWRHVIEKLAQQV